MINDQDKDKDKVFTKVTPITWTRKWELELRADRNGDSDTVTMVEPKQITDASNNLKQLTLWPSVVIISVVRVHWPHAKTSNSTTHHYALLVQLLQYSFKLIILLSTVSYIPTCNIPNILQTRSDRKVFEASSGQSGSNWYSSLWGTPVTRTTGTAVEDTTSLLYSRSSKTLPTMGRWILRKPKKKTEEFACK